MITTDREVFCLEYGAVLKKKFGRDGGRSVKAAQGVERELNCESGALDAMLTLRLW